VITLLTGRDAEDTEVDKSVMIFSLLIFHSQCSHEMESEIPYSISFHYTVTGSTQATAEKTGIYLEKYPGKGVCTPVMRKLS
jgi:hypothetical protein